LGRAIYLDDLSAAAVLGPFGIVGRSSDTLEALQ
jgi:hypothetical protein